MNKWSAPMIVFVTLVTSSVFWGLAIFICLHCSERNQGAEYYQNPTGGNQTIAKPGAPLVDLGTSEHRNNYSSDADNNPNSESSAAWVTARLTKGLIWIGAIQAAIYFGQMIWLVKTLNETKKASRSSLRAYVQIVPNSMFGIAVHGKLETGPLRVNLRVDNFGSTPAIKLRMNGGFFIEHNLPLGPDYILPGLGARAIAGIDVFPNSSVENEGKMKILVEQNWNLTQEEWNDILNESRSLYVFGKGAYRDMFGEEEHALEFCYALFHPGNLAKNLARNNVDAMFPVHGSVADIGNRIE